MLRHIAVNKDIKTSIKTYQGAVSHAPMDIILKNPSSSYARNIFHDVYNILLNNLFSSSAPVKAIVNVEGIVEHLMIVF